jgi:uncharacterized lipoprotein YddW (UPF0748 family)
MNKILKKKYFKTYLLVCLILTLKGNFSQAEENSEIPIKKNHLRAFWITSVYNLDWPSVNAKNTEDIDKRIEKTKSELIDLFDMAENKNFNAIFLQVSPQGDALYESQTVPWSKYLTGTFGKDPGFDPLEFAVEEAHKRNLEIHAWLNPYRVSTKNDDKTIKTLNIEQSVYKEHPDWIRKVNDSLMVDPGIPNVRDWIENRVLEIVKNYDIDGIHFDDYFYLNGLQDNTTYEKYNNGQFNNIKDWRRNNTYLLIKEIKEAINKEKSWIKFGVSPFSVWQNKSTSKEGSNTSSSYSNYNNEYADTKKWVEDELIDYIAPQVYFTFDNTTIPYATITSWWKDICKDKNVHLYIGQALYKVNEDSKFKEAGIDEFTNQLNYNIKTQDIYGSIFFRAKNIYDENRKDVISNVENIFKSKALVPKMEWKGGKAPSSPKNASTYIDKNKKVLTWDTVNNATYYALYRFLKSEQPDLSLNSGGIIFDTIRNNKNLSKTTYTLDTDNENYYYIVTALDRLHNESSGSTILDENEYFYDLSEKYNWAKDSINYLYEKNIIKGFKDNTFKPDLNIKRADFMLLLMRAFDIEADIKDNFNDVKKDSYYYDYLAKAKTAGIIKGYNGNFYPEKNITREDLSVLIYRIIDSNFVKINTTESKTSINFKDTDKISDYAKTPIIELAKLNIIEGYNNNINPKNFATRAESAVIIKRILDKKIIY